MYNMAVETATTETKSTEVDLIKHVAAIYSRQGGIKFNLQIHVKSTYFLIS